MTEAFIREYLSNLPTIQCGPIKVKILPGLPENAWYLVDLGIRAGDTECRSQTTLNTPNG